MKIILFYFSATGNTEKIAKLTAEALEKLGAEVDLYNIEKSDVPDISGYAKIGIAYPIHAFNAPQIVLKFARRLPETVKEKDLFVLKTSGEPLRINDVSSLKLLGILRKKGYKLKNEYHYIMPYDIIFRHTEAAAHKMLSTAKKLINVDSRAIYGGNEEKLPNFPLGGALAFVMRVEHFGSKLNGIFYRVDKDKCLMCLKCVKNCPATNISVKGGKIKFGGKCIMCTRCAFYCPADAVKIGLFNGWRVNGAYSFSEPKQEENDKHRGYCKKSYAKYYRMAEEKINRQTYNGEG